MGNLPLDVPYTWFDHIREMAAAVHKQRRQRRAAAAKRGSSAPAHPHLVLVERDQLFFRIVSRRSQAQTAAVADAFRDAFVAVWDRIPEPDRRRLLGYWHTDPARLPTDGPRPGPYARPRIRVLDDPTSCPSELVCGKLGTELTVPFDLVAEHADQLPFVIARALAVVHRLATCRHWALVQEIIEQPLGRWEQRKGKKADDAARDAKIDRLEAAHLRAYEKEIAAILRGWGFGPSGAARRR